MATPAAQLPSLDAQPPQFNAAQAVDQPKDNTPNPEVTEIANEIRTMIAGIAKLSDKAPDAKKKFVEASKALTEASLIVIQMQRPPDMPTPLAGA